MIWYVPWFKKKRRSLAYIPSEKMEVVRFMAYTAASQSIISSGSTSLRGSVVTWLVVAVVASTACSPLLPGPGYPPGWLPHSLQAYRCWWCSPSSRVGKLIFCCSSMAGLQRSRHHSYSSHCVPQAFHLFLQSSTKSQQKEKSIPLPLAL